MQEKDKIPVGKAKDISGQKYGRLTVLYRVAPPANITTKKPKSFWKCICECGNYTIVAVDKLNGGITKSCGCLSREKTSERFGIDITGQKFGKLTVIKKDMNPPSNQRLYWLCKCDCGNSNLESISGHDLRQGIRQQCSLCTPKSKGEEQIKSILLQNNILFCQEKTFDNCRFPDSNKKARFDFYVDNKYVIEFDGRQHIEETTGSCENWWSLAYVQNHDKIKNEYCKNNNIPLIRIPYSKINFIKLEDLMLETSKYRLF